MEGFVTRVGGLLISTLITLILAPTLYAFAVRDLKWIKWEGGQKTPELLVHDESADLVEELV